MTEKEERMSKLIKNIIKTSEVCDLYVSNKDIEFLDILKNELKKKEDLINDLEKHLKEAHITYLKFINHINDNIKEYGKGYGVAMLEISNILEKYDKHRFERIFL